MHDNNNRTRPSWLALEMLQLDELSSDREAEVGAYVQRNADVDPRLAQIDRDAAWPLPPLPTPSPSPSPQRFWGPRAWAWTLVGAAASAAAVLAIALAPPEPSPGVKGTPVALVAARERDGKVQFHPFRFRASDRIKLFLTCGNPQPVHWDVVILQRGKRSYPLNRGSSSCGNRVPLPGAFRLPEQQATQVCIAVSSAPLSPRPTVLTLSADGELGPSQPKTTLTCLGLDPEPSRP